MKLSEFDYSYPEELIAQRPAAARDASRLMLIDRNAESLRHSHVRELPNALRAGDLLVINDTRVIPARLFGSRANGEEIELLVVEPEPGETAVWRCMVRRAKRIRAGEEISFGDKATACVRGRHDIYVLVEFDPEDFDIALKHHGVPPLPPYIRREGIEAYSAEDRERYQTVYADKAGSAAAPTAGLHLSETLIADLVGHGVEIVRVTLHVGIDTFTPVRTEDLSEHRMHGERVTITAATAAAIAAAKKDARRVIAVGTTTARALESAASEPEDGAATCGRFNWNNGSIAHGQWVTHLFIQPGYEFRAIDGMLTNFHQPRSTLIVMVSAFAGRELIMRSYQEAIQQRYRLFSYGDCMLVL